ncbi:glycoside hydrolase domain-containing protein, partial [Thomasclavelia spiroformis]|uniref:glycoside hydrolase domain-containing protein n=2 Tax=Thomasclavelia spiroformis TaxID=29348 RepID=UPI00320873BC
MITGMVTLTNILGSASTVFAKESTNYEITTNNYETKDLVQHVNPLIGTNNFKGDSEWSGTAPLVSAPFGMTNFTPQTRENRIGDISYEYKDTKFKGFFATHQPAIWMGDYGYVNVMPQIGDVSPDQDGRALTFSHDDETATPYYYKVTAGKEEGKPITAEMTATERCAIYRFTYPSSDEAKIFVESARGRGNGHIEIDEDYEKYIQSSKKWLNNWDENLVSSDGYKGFIHKRAEDGSYATVDPSHFLGYDGTEMKWQGYGDDFYEAGIWEGSYSPTFDLPTLVEKMGGKYAYADRLDYALGQGYINFANEPAFQTIWTLASDEVQRPDLASKWVDVYLSKYTDVGYPGDEDNGAMSSMYLFMMSGFFPMSGTNNYYLHGTHLPEVTYHLGTGNDLVIKGINVSDENIYVQSATWNGQPLTSSKLTWEQIKEGGTLEYVMGSQPSDWAREVDNENPSDVTGLILDDSKLNEGTLALNWNEATDNTQIKQYNIYSSTQEDFELNDETLVTSTKDTTYTFDVSNEVKYFKVEAEDYFGNKSLNSPLIKVDISDFEKPILTGEIQLDERYLDIGLVKFSWPEATDNIKIKEYRVYRSNEENYDLDETSLLTATNDLSYSETKQAGTFYYTVVAVDLFGNVSDSLKLKVENSNGLTGKKLKSTENIAKNKNVTASGRHSEAEDGKYAVDGNTKTKWCSKDNESSANPDFWLEIDLGDVYQLNKWVVKHAQAGGEQASYNTRDFKLQVKSGDEWLDVDSVVGNTDSTTSRTLPMFEGRYVRLYVTNPTQANQARTTRIYEVELYGDKDYSTFTGSIMKTPGIEVSVNHAVNENEDAIKAIDFDTNTKWSCRNSNDDNGYYWLEVKLPQKYRVNALELLSAEKENASYITRDFQLQVKENGEWKDVHNVTDNQENLYYANLETPVIGDNFRLLIKKLGSANEDNARVYEFHLYGDKVVDSDKTALKIAVDLANAITDEDLDKVIPAVAN